MKPRNKARIVGLTLGFLILAGFLYRINHPCLNLWEEVREESYTSKILEIITPVFITLWSLIMAYRLSIEKSKKAIDVAAHKDYWPIESWTGLIAMLSLLLMITVNAVSDRAKSVSIKVEKIIALCDNDSELQRSYLTINSKQDLEAFKKLALQKKPNDAAIKNVIRSMNFY